MDEAFKPHEDSQDALQSASETQPDPTKKGFYFRHSEDDRFSDGYYDQVKLWRSDQKQHKIYLVLEDGTLQDTFQNEKERRPKLTEDEFLEEQRKVLDTPEKIYSFLAGFLNYRPDPKGTDSLQRAKETMKTRTGDCEDYSEYAKELLHRNDQAAYGVTLMTPLGENHAVCLIPQFDGTEHSFVSVCNMNIARGSGETIQAAYFQWFKRAPVQAKRGYLHGGTISPMVNTRSNIFVPVERLGDQDYIDAYARLYKIGTSAEIDKALQKYEGDPYLLHLKMKLGMFNKYSKEGLQSAIAILKQGHFDLPFVLSTLEKSKLLTPEEKQNILREATPAALRKYQISLRISDEDEFTNKFLKSFLESAGYTDDEQEMFLQFKKK